MKRAVVMLAAATATALATAAAIIAFVREADFLTGAARAVASAALDHAALGVGAAVSPLVATLLVGYAYMRRGMARRAAGNARLPLPSHGGGSGTGVD